MQSKRAKSGVQIKDWSLSFKTDPQSTLLISPESEPNLAEVSYNPTLLKSPWDTVFDVILTELGLEMDDEVVLNDSEWIEPGLDSLIQLSILGHLQEDIEMPRLPTLFEEFPTVRYLRTFFEQTQPMMAKKGTLSQHGVQLQRTPATVVQAP
jgi:hypothetical protein